MATANQQPLTALVTGATAGLGKAIALRLARNGQRARVVMIDALSELAFVVRSVRRGVGD